MKFYLICAIVAIAITFQILVVSIHSTEAMDSNMEDAEFVCSLYRPAYEAELHQIQGTYYCWLKEPDMLISLEHINPEILEYKLV